MAAEGFHLTVITRGSPNSLTTRGHLNVGIPSTSLLQCALF